MLGALETPPAVAMMVTVPCATPVAKPLLLMVATEALLQNQAMLAPGTGLPLLSCAVAVNCCVPFTAMVADRGETTTLATAGVTVSVAGLLATPEAVAVICVLPGDSALATPSLLIVATVGALLAQRKATVTWLPPLSTAVAVKVALPPATAEAEEGLTVTEAGMVVVEVPCPPHPASNRIRSQQAHSG